jgi:hypothetical protein
MKYTLNMTREEMDAEDARRGKLGEVHKELSLLLDFPPFSIDEKQRQMFSHEFIHAIDDQEDDPYAGVMKKWADEIDEARMYQKRYSDDPEAATQAAAKLQGG